MKKKISIESIPVDSSFIDISCLSISSLAFLDRFTHIFTLDASRTHISNLKGVHNISSIANIKIAATPLAMLKHYRLMLLIVFGSKLSSIDDILVSNSERKLADSMRESLRSFLFDGWVLTKLNPTTIKKDNIEKIIDKETGTIKTKNLSYKNAASKKSKTASNNNGNKKKSVSQEAQAEEQPRRRLCPVFDFRNKPLFGQNHTSNTQECLKETNSSSIASNSDESQSSNSNSPSKIRQSLSVNQISPKSKNLIIADSNSENIHSENAKEENSKQDLAQINQVSIVSNSPVYSPKKNSNIKYSFSMTNSFSLDPKKINENKDEEDKIEYSWQNIFEISPKGYRNAITNVKNKKDITNENENQNQKNEKKSLQVLTKNGNDKNNQIDEKKVIDTRENLKTEKTQQNHSIHHIEEEEMIDESNYEKCDIKDNQANEKSKFSKNKNHQIELSLSERQIPKSDYHSKLDFNKKISKPKTEEKINQEKLEEEKQTERFKKINKDQQKIIDKKSSEIPVFNKKTQKKSNDNEKFPENQNLEHTKQEKTSNNQKTDEKINLKKHQEETLLYDQKNQQEKTYKIKQRLAIINKLNTKQQQNEICKKNNQKLQNEENLKNQEEAKFITEISEEKAIQNKLLYKNSDKSTKHRDRSNNKQKIINNNQTNLIKIKNPSRLQEKILNFLKSQKEEEELGNEEEEEEFEFSDDQPPSINLFSHWRKQSINNEEDINQSIQSTQKFISVNNNKEVETEDNGITKYEIEEKVVIKEKSDKIKSETEKKITITEKNELSKNDNFEIEIESDDSIFNDTKKSTIKARIEKIRQKIRSNQMLSDDDTNIKEKKNAIKQNSHHTKSDDDETFLISNKNRSKSDNDIDDNENQNLSIKVCNTLKKFQNRCRSDYDELTHSRKIESIENDTSFPENIHKSKSNDDEKSKPVKLFSTLKRLHSRSDDDENSINCKIQLRPKNSIKGIKSNTEEENEITKTQMNYINNNNANIKEKLAKYQSKSDDESDKNESLKIINSFKQRLQNRSENDDRLRNSKKSSTNDKTNKPVTKVNITTNISRIYRKSNRDISLLNDSLPESSNNDAANNNCYPLLNNVNKISHLDDSNQLLIVSDDENILNQIHLPSESAQIDEFLELEKYAQNHLSESQDQSENQFESENDFEIELEKSKKEENKAAHFKFTKTDESQYEDDDFDDYNDAELDDESNFNSKISPEKDDEKENKKFKHKNKKNDTLISYIEEEGSRNRNIKENCEEDETENQTQISSLLISTNNNEEERDSETEIDKNHRFFVQYQNNESIDDDDDENNNQKFFTQYQGDFNKDRKHENDSEEESSDHQGFLIDYQEDEDENDDSNKYSRNIEIGIHKKSRNGEEDMNSSNSKNEYDDIDDLKIEDKKRAVRKSKEVDIVSPFQCISQKNEDGYEIEESGEERATALRFDSNYTLDSEFDKMSKAKKNVHNQARKSIQKVRSPSSIIRGNSARNANNFEDESGNDESENMNQKINFDTQIEYDDENYEIENNMNNRTKKKKPKVPSAADLLSAGDDEEAEIIMPSDFLNDLQLSINLSDGNEEEEEEERKNCHSKKLRKIEKEKDLVKPSLHKQKILKKPKVNQIDDIESQKVTQKPKLNIKVLKKKILKNKKRQRQKNEQKNNEIDNEI